MKQLIFLYLLLLFYRYPYAQTRGLDSLINRLKYEKKDSARVDLLKQISYQYENAKPDSSLLLARQGLSLAKTSGYVRGEIGCLNMIGLSLMTIGDYPKALGYLLESLKKAEAIEDRRLMATALINIGVVYSSQDDRRQGIHYQLQALPISKALNQRQNTAVVLLDLGDNYENLGVQDSALYYTDQCYALARQIPDSNLLGLALNNFGNIYRALHKDSLALRYYRSDLLYLKRTEDNDDLCETYLGMAGSFQQTGERDSCLYYAKLALRIAKPTGFL